MLGFQKILAKSRTWVCPAISGDIRPALERAQFESVRSQVPMLLAVAALNTMIIMAVCAHDGLPLAHYGWMSALVLYCVARIGFWLPRLNDVVDAEQIPRLLRMNVGASLTMITCLGIATTAFFLGGTFRSELLIPMSLGFGATSIAHCLYTLRPAAIGTVVMGLFPSSLAMIGVGNFDAKMLGLAMISVGILMLRFVTTQHDQLIASLHLEKQNHDLANTDVLTALANRRAMMAALEIEAATGKKFGVALLDLDGFKDVNDRLGHHAGDMMLRQVGERLVSSALSTDSVGRLGGDEFIILLRDLDGGLDLSARTTAMMATLCQPVNIDEHILPVAASLGYAQWDPQYHTIDLLLRAADSALYGAKRSRRSKPVDQHYPQARLG